MSKLFATAGAKLYIGPAKAFTGTPFVLADFTDGDPAFTEIKGASNLGTVGDKAELVTLDEIGTARTRKAKGVRNAGSMQVVIGLDAADAGQLALLAAEASDDTYMIKVQFNDAPAGGTPSLRYFAALVMSVEEGMNEGNTALVLNAALEIDGNIVKVAAAGP